MTVPGSHEAIIFGTALLRRIEREGNGRWNLQRPGHGYDVVGRACSSSSAALAPSSSASAMIVEARFDDQELEFACHVCLRGHQRSLKARRNVPARRFVPSSLMRCSMASEGFFGRHALGLLLGGASAVKPSGSHCPARGTFVAVAAEETLFEQNFE